MIKLKDIGFAGIVLAAGVLSPVVMAQTVVLHETPYSSSFGGLTAGEFGAVPTGSFAPPIDPATDYSSYTRYGTTGFDTFCVETTVDFTPGTTYNLALSLNALGSANPLSPIPLSVGAAYLYSQFAKGMLSGYDFANSGAGTSAPSTVSGGNSDTRLTDAGSLQAALWYLEGGQSLTSHGYPSGITGNIYYTDALNYVEGLGYTSSELTTAVTSEGEFGVEIMNLTATSGGGAAQNQLVYLGGGSGLTHERIPDGGATLALLGLSLAGLSVFARRSGGGQRVS